MKTLRIPLFIILLLPFAAEACPIGMQFNGNGCSPPYEYTGWDWLRDQNDYIDSLGPKGPPARGLSLEESRALQQRLAQQEKEKEEKKQAYAKGIWHVDSKSTPEGNLCAALFSKYTPDEGGVVSIMGFQKPKPDAWLIFHGVGLPQPKKIKKIKISLQQDDEPAQMIQVFNYKEFPQVGTVAFAVPSLTALLDGMRDKQSFKLSIDGKLAMTIQWADATPVIAQLKQCAK